MYPAAHIHPPLDLVSSGDSPMLTPQNLILNRPFLTPLTHPEPGQQYSFVPSLASLSSEYLIAAPSEEDDEEDEIDPEDTEDHLDEQEEDEDDHEDFDDEDDDDDQLIENDEEDDEDIEDEEDDEDDEDDEEDEEHDPESDSVEYFQQPSRSMPRSRRV
jgi:hypothetical protein